MVAFPVRWAPLSLLAGCPYIWAAPTDPPGVEADTDVDTDTDSDVPPVIEEVDVTARLDDVEVAVDAWDADGDLARLEVDGGPEGPVVLRVDPLDGPWTLQVPWPQGCAPVDAVLEVIAEDAAGHLSPLPAPVTRPYVDLDTDAPDVPWFACGSGERCVRFVADAPFLVQVEGDGASVQVTVDGHATEGTAPFEQRFGPGERTDVGLCVRGRAPWRVGVSR